MRNVLRHVFVITAAIGGLFLFVASAAVAFFVVSGIVIIALASFAILWVRAKLFGKSFGPQAHFEKARADMEAQFQTYSNRTSGPVLDAHRTPDGWSVDD